MGSDPSDMETLVQGPGSPGKVQAGMLGLICGKTVYDVYGSVILDSRTKC